MFTFLPHVSMSMENRLTMGTPVADVLTEFAGLREFKESAFDAHPTLQRCARDVTSFLVQSRDRMTPALKDTTLPTFDVPADPCRP
jgi:hypothetical protein